MIESKVLLVDDAEAILDTLSQILERLGVPGENIHIADSAAGAMKQFHALQPAVVFMDVNLGKDKGDEVALQMLASAPATKVILMTGLDAKDPRVRDVVSAGAFDVIEKPIRLNRLKQVLELVESEEKGLRRI